MTGGSGPACLSTLVSASWAIRYTVRPVPGGRCARRRPCGRATTRSAAGPHLVDERARCRRLARAAGVERAVGRRRWLEAAAGPARAPPSGRRGRSPARRTPSSRRMSVSAARPVSAIVPSARVAAAGSASAAYRPPSACAIITDSEWATMSCISRAMRARSAAVAICACWSRSTSSRSGAVDAGPSMVSRRERRTSPNAQTRQRDHAGEHRGRRRRPAASHQPSDRRRPSRTRADERADDRDAVRPARAVHRHRVQRDAARRGPPARRAGPEARGGAARRCRRRRRTRPGARGARPAGATTAIAISGAATDASRRRRASAMSVDVTTMSEQRGAPVPVASTANRCALLPRAAAAPTSVTATSVGGRGVARRAPAGRPRRAPGRSAPRGARRGSRGHLGAPRPGGQDRPVT